jgi:hypothetical protein
LKKYRVDIGSPGGACLSVGVDTSRDVDAVMAALRAHLREVLESSQVDCPGVVLTVHRLQVCEHEDPKP